MPKLFDLFVEFSQKGAQAVSAAMQDLQQQSAQLARGMQGISDRQLALAAQAAQTLARQAEQAAARVRLIEDMVARGPFRVMAEQVGKALNPALQLLARAGTVAAASLSGLVVQGVRASAWGQLFGFQLERLSRVAAGLFGPEIEALYRGLSRLTDRLANLTAQQRTNVAHTIQAIAAFKVFTSLTTALLPVLGGVGAATVGLAAGLVVSERGVLGLMEALKPLQTLLEAVGRGLGAIGFEGAQGAVRFLIFAGTVATVVTVLGRLAAAWEAVTKATKAATAATAIFQAVTGAGLLKLAVGAAAGAGVLALLDKMEKDAEKGGRGETGKRAGPPEAIESTFLRIAQASVAVGPQGSVEQQQLDTQKGIFELLKDALFKERPREGRRMDFGIGTI